MIDLHAVGDRLRIIVGSPLGRSTCSLFRVAMKTVGSFSGTDSIALTTGSSRVAVPSCRRSVRSRGPPARRGAARRAQSTSAKKTSKLTPINGGFTAYGRIFQAQDVRADSYTDTILVTVNY